MIINCDGGSRGNPGPAAIGIVLWDDDRKIIETHKEYIGIATNNIAEYKSLIKALKLALMQKASSVEVYMDSELVIRQVNGEYKVRAERLLPLFSEVEELKKEFHNITFSSLPRDDHYQAYADRLVNEALDAKA